MTDRPPDRSASLDRLRHPGRLSALREAGLMDSPPEESFDRVLRLAARLLGVPFAQINLVDDRRQFSKSCIAPPQWSSGRDCALDDSFCKHTVLGKEPFLVEDGRAHPLVSGSAVVTDQGLVAYAGVPLITPDDHALGALCVGDFVPRRWTAADVESLRDLAGCVVAEIELRRERQRIARAGERAADGYSALLSLVEHMPGMAYRCGNTREWPLELVSPGVELITGYTPEEFTSGQVAYGDLIHPEDRERVWEVVQDAIAARRPFRLEYRLRARDGDERWVWEQGEGVFSPRGELEALEGFVKDATDRKRAEHRLARNEATLRSVLQSSPDVVELLHPDSRFRWVSPAVQEVLGFSEHELDGQSMLEFVHPGERDRVAAALDGLVARETDEIRLRYRARRQNGTWVVLEARGRRVEDGNSDGIVLVARDVSEQARLEEALRQSEAHYRELFHGSPFPMWAIDPDTLAFLDANAAAVRLYGYSLEEFRSMTLHDIRPPDESPALLQALARAREEDGFISMGMARHRARDGSTLHVEVFAQDVERGDRKIRIAVGHDVTLRREAEAALRESHELMNSIIEGSPDAIYTKDLDGRYLLVNSAGAKLLGRTAEEIVGQRDSDIFPAELARAFREDDLRAIRSDRVLAFDMTAPVKGGERTFSTVKMPRRDHEGRVVGVIGIARDITERQAAEAALRESEERFRQLVAGVREVFWMFDPDYQEVLYVSPGYERVFGRGCEQFVKDPRTCLKAVVPRDRDRMRELLLNLRAGPRSEVVEIVWPDGEHRWLEVRGFPVRDAAGNVYRIAGVTEDITEQRRAEGELRAAMEEAERANRAKSEFLSRMSHELRTPMNAILGFAQILELDLEKEEDQESVQQILRAGRHLLRLIDEVLDLARIEAERVSLSLEPVWVGAVVRESLELVRSMATERSVSIRTGACDHFVQADQQRLKQILLNLMSNAIKYNREGGTVTISCEEVADRVRIRVADTGRGLAPEQQARLFVPFERLGAEQTGISGTGLGLSLSRGLADAMGGQMGVDSVPGEGSVFWVELSRVDPPESGDEVSPPSDLSEPHQRVLYIEDNLANLRLVERILAQRPDVALIPAMQGRIGLDLAREHRPDVILLDVHLPDIPGDEVLTELQRDPVLSGIPVVVISADATPHQIERMREAGAREYLTKPIDVSRFLEALDAALAEPGPAE